MAQPINYLKHHFNGLPEASPEYRFHHVRRWRFDYAWPDFSVALEVHGGVWSGGRHTNGQGFINDRIKMNEAQILGWTVIEVTPMQVQDGTARDLVSRAIMANKMRAAA